MDSRLRKKLNGLNQHIEVCDDTGQTVGHFLPARLFDELFYSALAGETNTSKEEVQRQHREPPGRTLQEIWERLGVT